MSLDPEKICEFCGENVRGYGHRDNCPEYDHSDDHYSGPRGNEAAAELRHSQEQARKLK